MNGLFSIALSGCIKLANWYWGGFDGLLSSLFVFVAMARISDGMCAIVDHKPLNRGGIQEMFKSILIIILVGIGNILDTHVLANTPALRTAVILFYLSTEGLILLENAVHLGLPIPEHLKILLEKMRQNRLDSNDRHTD